ncbi:hypothetical protein CVT24_007116 [Panaeolus cyanescens]|uniref:Uncharacterized protein n=1 Tax=Panaeolus cyanescens TaxID=181874 RepID=A0A409VJV5_9AGAR|nr:hypothetical protein CVT24_007116 [Panaeolus cyanescens]
MYAGYGASSPPLTNNPFVSESAANRFPDISGASNYNQQSQASWNGGSNMNNGYPQQGQVVQSAAMYQQTQYPQQHQYQTTGYAMQQQGMGTTAGYAPTGYGGQQPHHFQPSSAFGQQLAANVNGSSYSYLSSQQQQPSSGYNPVQQQLQSPTYVAQFDPYAAIGQGWGESSNSAQHNTASSGYTAQTGIAGNYGGGTGGSQFANPTGAAGYSANGEPHPREYLRTHKGEIEAWDAVSWKQLLGAFEGLKRSWEGRKDELNRKVKEAQVQLQYAGYYAPQVQAEVTRLQFLLKDAESNFDTVAASTFQMQEVFQNYRQSSDPASKRRVREATNASLQGLPMWPQPY